MPAKPKPDGYHSVTPYLTVKGVPSLIRFLKEAFAAKELMRVRRPDGSVEHAEVRIGDSVVMMGEARAMWKPMPTWLYLYVDDCDAVYRRALKAGGVSVYELADQPYAGDRFGGVKDPGGNIWWIATHVEDLDAEESERRIMERLGGSASARPRASVNKMR